MKEKKMLVVTGSYLPDLNAIGVCLEAIIYEFKKKGYKPYVVTMADGPEYAELDGCKIYNVPIEKPKIMKPAIVRKCFTGFRIIKNYPLEGSGYIRKITDRIRNLLNENKFEFVLCAQKPLLSGILGIKIKEINSELPVMLYELDSFTDNNSNFETWTRFFAGRNAKLEKRVFDKMDYIIHLIEHKNYYQQDKYKAYLNKSIYVDIPLLDSRLNDPDNNVKKENGILKGIYSGMLYKGTRSPEYFISLLNGLDSEINVECSFYSRGDYEVMLRHEQSINNKVRACGYIEKSKLDEEMKNTDFFINISNDYSKNLGVIPSKLFYYMSFGKPIIHISSGKNDLCVPYLKKYPSALIISTEKSFEDNVKELDVFLKTLPRSICSYDMLEKDFYENTPAYTVEKILNLLA